MSGSAPMVRDVSEASPAVAAASDDQTIIGKAPFAGTVTAVTYIPEATITGANTETRTISVVNRGTDGSGTDVIASLALVSGVNATAKDEKAITLSATAADLVVAEGDVLEFRSIHSGSTGLADPGGRVTVTIDRADVSA